jgi:hypothetical protein
VRVSALFSFGLPQLLTLASLLTGVVAAAEPASQRRAAPLCDEARHCLTVQDLKL